MLTVHHVNAFLVLGLSFATAVTGFIAYRRRSEAGRLLAHLIALVQTLLVAQVALGLLLLSATTGVRTTTSTTSTGRSPSSPSSRRGSTRRRTRAAGWPGSPALPCSQAPSDSAPT